MSSAKLKIDRVSAEGTEAAVAPSARLRGGGSPAPTSWLPAIVLLLTFFLYPTLKTFQFSTMSGSVIGEQRVRRTRQLWANAHRSRFLPLLMGHGSVRRRQRSRDHRPRPAPRRPAAASTPVPEASPGHLLLSGRSLHGDSRRRIRLGLQPVQRRDATATPPGDARVDQLAAIDGARDSGSRRFSPHGKVSASTSSCSWPQWPICPRMYLDAAKVDGATNWQTHVACRDPSAATGLHLRLGRNIVYGFQNFALVFSLHEGVRRRPRAPCPS